MLVIGGGPAGTTAATLLARKGWRVMLLEKDAHPRFHIGESLLPMNLPILERLGVLEQVHAIGMFKPGAEFPITGRTGRRHDYNTFRFERALNPQFGYAYQVKREEFDQLLFRHAQANGVDARENTKVERVEFGADGRPARGARAQRRGRALMVTPRYVVDASGRDAFFGSQLKLKRKNALHQSAAIFSHFSGVQRRDGEDAGNITVQRFAHGWMWLIPLREGVMSVGAVCFPEYLKQRRGETESVPDADAGVRAVGVARACSRRERIAPVHVTGNYSYTCTRMTRPGLGDGRRRLCLRRPGVLLGRVPGHEQRRAGGRGRRRRAARARARGRAAARDGDPPQARPQAFPVVHLPLHHAGDAPPVQQPAQRSGRSSRR